MKKNIFIISFIAYTMLISCVKAQEADFYSLINDYDKNSSFGKIISTQDYQKAVETRESFNKKAKKTKKKKKDKETEPEEQKTESPLIFSMPESSAPLLTLPVDAQYENTIIKQGFYLVNLSQDGGKYYLELRQHGKTPVARIEATCQIAPGNNILQHKTSVENIDDKYIKLNYSENSLILEAILWKL
jgi:hypothetical protein